MDYEVIGYKIEVHWDEVDWLDVGISGVGIVGDVALYSTPASSVVGGAAWGLSEIVEVVGIAGNLKSAFDYINEGDASGFIFEGLKAVGKGFGLAPAVGWIGDGASIGFNILEATYVGPVLREKSPPIHYNFPGGPTLPSLPFNTPGSQRK